MIFFILNHSINNKTKNNVMITVVYCTKEPNQDHIDHIIKSSGLRNNIQVIEIINNSDSKSPFYTGGESLTKAYNRGLEQAKNDVVVFCHDDTRSNFKIIEIC